MEAADEEKPLLNAQTNPQDVGSEYTSDGSVDINKRPALKGSTGRWRACYMILGNTIKIRTAIHANCTRVHLLLFLHAT
uniref:Uncharacterized protein n=1 Tax=Triticum urartu TaxID=4572 RepID=A0A8R7VFI1_TRIUA